MREESRLYTTPEGYESGEVGNVLGPRIDAIVDGTWAEIDWVGFPELSRRSWLLPGTICMVSGDPGTTKSLVLLAMLHRWHDMGRLVAMMALEGGPELHLNRLLAMLAKSWDVLSPKWGREHPDELRAIHDQHSPEIDSFAKRLYSAPPGQLRYDRLLKWVKERLDDGVKILCVDPITFVSTGESRHVEDLGFIATAARMLEESGARLIIVTHPRGSTTNKPKMEDMAGGLSFSRHTQSILWLSSGSKRVKIMGSCGVSYMSCNRIIHVMKHTHGPGQGDRIGFNLTPTMEFSEQGVIEKSKKKADDDDGDEQPGMF